MDTMTFLWIFFVICLCLSIFGAIHNARRSPKEKWKEEQLALGRRPQDVDDEAAVRLALAELRREVSQVALGNGPWRVALEVWRESQSARLTRRTPRLGKRYLDIVAALDDSDILWPEAYKVAFPPGPELEQIEITLEQLALAKKLLVEDERAAFGK